MLRGFLYLFFGCFEGCYYFITVGVEFRVFFLAFGMLEDILQGSSDAYTEGDFRPHVRHKAFQLHIIKDDRAGFVPKKPAFKIVAVFLPCFREEIAGYMHRCRVTPSASAMVW